MHHSSAELLVNRSRAPPPLEAPRNLAALRSRPRRPRPPRNRRERAPQLLAERSRIARPPRHALLRPREAHLLLHRADLGARGHDLAVEEGDVALGPRRRRARSPPWRPRSGSGGPRCAQHLTDRDVELLLEATKPGPTSTASRSRPSFHSRVVLSPSACSRPRSSSPPSSRPGQAGRSPARPQRLQPARRHGPDGRSPALAQNRLQAIPGEKLDCLSLTMVSKTSKDERVKRPAAPALCAGRWSAGSPSSRSGCSGSARSTAPIWCAASACR